MLALGRLVVREDGGRALALAEPLTATVGSCGAVRVPAWGAWLPTAGWDETEASPATTDSRDRNNARYDFDDCIMASTSVNGGPACEHTSARY